MAKDVNDVWEAPPPDQVGGITEVVGGTPENPITFYPSPKPDDFNRIGEEPEVVRPRADSPCPRCQTVHAKEGNPLCVCVKCEKFSRIVWCGQCVACAYERHCAMPQIGKEIADQLPLFRDYVDWKHQQEVEAARVNKMPWEK